MPHNTALVGTARKAARPHIYALSPKNFSIRDTLRRQLAISSLNDCIGTAAIHSSASCTPVLGSKTFLNTTISFESERVNDWSPAETLSMNSCKFSVGSVFISVIIQMPYDVVESVINPNDTNAEINDVNAAPLIFEPVTTGFVTGVTL